MVTRASLIINLFMAHKEVNKEVNKEVDKEVDRWWPRENKRMDDVLEKRHAENCETHRSVARNTQLHSRTHAHRATRHSSFYSWRPDASFKLTSTARSPLLGCDGCCACKLSRDSRTWYDETGRS